MQEPRYRLPSHWFTPTRCPACSCCLTLPKNPCPAHRISHGSGWVILWCNTRHLEGFTPMPTRRSTYPSPVLQFRPRTTRDSPSAYKAGARTGHTARDERFRTFMDTPRAVRTETDDPQKAYWPCKPPKRRLSPPSARDCLLLPQLGDRPTRPNYWDHILYELCRRSQ